MGSFNVDKTGRIIGASDVAINFPAHLVSSVFGRAGAVVAQAGDYTVAEVTGAAAIAGQVFTGVISAPNLSGTNTGDQNLAPYALLSGASFTGAITANTSDSISTIAINDTGTNGANLALYGNGTVTPNKYIRANGGSFQILNNAYSASIFSVADTGNITATGNIAAAGNINCTDVYAVRGASQGVVFLGSSKVHYLYFDGTNYQLPAGNLNVNGKQVAVTGYSILPSTIAVGASPFSYQNTTGYDADILVDIGTVSSIAFSRDNITYYQTGMVTGIIHLSPNDWIKVAYTIAPTITLIPR